jgi:hypothetical protein
MDGLSSIVIETQDGGWSQPLTDETEAQAAAIVAARNSNESAGANPWRPGAHDEERLAVGGRQQVVVCDRYPPDNTTPDRGYEPAPGGAGRWRFDFTTPVTDHTGDSPVTYTTKAWARWTVPSEVTP